ncbi:MAG: hypothetical protein Q7S51_07730 [Gallionellaceae bacterium]|nr:hypothetical protein [Gallionellaceae bacterium]
MLVVLTGCGSGPQTGTTGSTTTTTTALPTLTIALASTTLPTQATATVRDAAGALVSGVVVTFATDATLATMSPSTGTALTNSSGVATINLAATVGTAGGATNITATAQVAGTTVSSLIGFTVGAVAVPSLTMSAPTFGAASISALGTTSVDVSVFSAGVLVTTPQTVTFSSPCASAGKAVLTPSASTIAGVATVSYRDINCAGTDLVTASTGTISSSATITVAASSAGSIQFISASPTTISLQGTGGVEVSQVTFKVVDVGGSPIGGKVVTFTLSTSTGGITLTPTPATATSGPDGLVVTNVNAGTVSTPVRVTASTPGATAGTTLNTQSNVLTITTGIPDQDSFSLSATETNIEGWGYDGTTTTLTVRLADHFNNPVPDGTAINFTTEGANVVASCVASGGSGGCSSTFTSQQPRPLDGRVTVLAYAVGEESFLDRDGDGLASKVNSLSGTTELVDSNGSISSDMPEAFRDDNEDGVRQTSETFIDFNSNSAYDAADSSFNGVLCREAAAGGTSSAGTCSSTKTIHVRASNVIILSGSFATISASPASITLAVGGCGPTQTVDYRIVDLHNNSMPVGTTITFTADNGTIVGPSSITVPNDTNNYPLATDYNYSVGIKGDGTVDPTTGCQDTTPNGSLTVTVRTPKNNVSSLSINVVN